MKNLVFVKLGGSLITDKARPYTARFDVIKRLCREIHEAKSVKKLHLVVGHGGGSFPHISAKQYQTHRGVVNDKSWEGFSKVQDDAARLNRIVVSSLIEAGEKAFSVQPSASCHAKNDRITEWYTRPLETSLEKGMVPVPYGDVCFDATKGCCIVSTEEIFRFLSRRFRPDRIIMAGKTDGVLNELGATIKKIDKKNFDDIKEALEASDGFADVTGGMLQKVAASLQMGAEVEIINGLEPSMLKRALLGERGLGTLIKG